MADKGEAARFYSIDASALIDLQLFYPRVTFPGLWERIEVMVVDGRIVAPGEVLAELERKDDELVRWARGQTHLFVPWSHELVEAAQEVIRRFPGLVDPNKTIPDADPFVIAAAWVAAKEPPADLFLGSAKWAVVTTQRSPHGVRIPGVCSDLGLDCLDLQSFFAQEGWVLR